MKALNDSHTDCIAWTVKMLIRLVEEVVIYVTKDCGSDPLHLHTRFYGGSHNPDGAGTERCSVPQRVLDHLDDRAGNETPVGAWGCFDRRGHERV